MKRSELYEAPRLDTVECQVEYGIAMSQADDFTIESLLYEEYTAE